MKKVFLVIKKILLIFWWQDIEKSNFFVRILNSIWAFTLSFGAFSLVYSSNMNLIFKIIIGTYLILSFMSFWPTSHLLDNKDEVEGGIFYIFQRVFILFSFIILLRYVINDENI
ncbi:hypothetical protein [Clostridium weizhouense]|uniref:Uncharacterized protein n=1 Tax=Clostridium weizhouense TaxID=2859781 RepID=A0ABS7AP80_9CLOT|nr:hypothetical protein [Clostridium weizhouense]MBW6409290.1 hypothetical protein [Clostridium weizhouense]